MKINRIKRVNYRRRYRLLKSMKNRVVVRITNRSVVIQLIKGGFNPAGDLILNTALFHKTMRGVKLNTSTIDTFSRLTFEKLQLSSAILDLGQQRLGTRLRAVSRNFVALAK